MTAIVKDPSKSSAAVSTTQPCSSNRAHGVSSGRDASEQLWLGLASKKGNRVRSTLAMSSGIALMTGVNLSVPLTTRKRKIDEGLTVERHSVSIRILLLQHRSRRATPITPCQ